MQAQPSQPLMLADDDDFSGLDPVVPVTVPTYVSKGRGKRFKPNGEEATAASSSLETAAAPPSEPAALPPLESEQQVPVEVTTAVDDVDAAIPDTESSHDRRQCTRCRRSDGGDRGAPASICGRESTAGGHLR